ncbi:MAG: DinB family protein [Acidobacteriota bacterium]
MAKDSLNEFIAKLNQVTADVQSTFAGLSTEQLNWKPSAEEWSIAQCLDHLIATNRPYFEPLREATNPARKQTLWQSMPLLPSLFGNLLANAVKPDAKRKIKAPAKFQPSSSSIDASITKSFAETQRELIDLMNGTSRLDLERLVISSPVSDFVTYSLLDAYRILSNHEQRHFQQAKRVLNSSGFPKS